jgi:hypothetical protein
MGVPRLVSADSDSGKLPDVVLFHLDDRYNQRVIDTQYSSLDSALQATPIGGVLEIRSPRTVTSPFVVNKACQIVMSQAGSITTTANISAVQVTADDVLITGGSILGPGSGTAGVGTAIEIKSAKRARIVGVKISGFSKYGILMDSVSDFLVEGCDLSDIAYGGVMMLSCTSGTLERNRVRNITQPSGFVNSYGIAATRDSSKTVTASPRSAQILISNNLIDGVPKWEGIDTHAGTEITITNNVVRNTNVGIALVPGVGTDGADLYGAQNCLVSGNIIDSTMSDGSRSSGVQIVGAGITLGSPIEAASGCVVTNNTVRRHGKEAGGANDGAITMYNTMGAVVSANTVIEGGVRGIHVYHDNQRATIFGNTLIDAWSDTIVYSTAIHISSTFNTVSIGMNVAGRGTKSAAKVNDRGLFVATGTSNTITDLSNDFDSCTTPVADTGNVSSIQQRAKKVGYFGATPVVRPSGTPSAATDATTTQALVNDLRAKLMSLGLIG